MKSEDKRKKKSTHHVGVCGKGPPTSGKRKIWRTTASKEGRMEWKVKTIRASAP